MKKINSKELIKINGGSVIIGVGLVKTGVKILGGAALAKAGTNAIGSAARSFKRGWDSVE